MNITLARTRAVYGLSEVQGALDRSKGRSPELEAFYERMLDNGADRFVTTPFSIDALSPLADECPNFDQVVDDLRRNVALANAGDGGIPKGEMFAWSDDERVECDRSRSSFERMDGTHLWRYCSSFKKGDEMA